jgi:DNA ligase-1
MLHRGDSLYRAERSDDLLKLKPYQDADAQVIAHLPGKGKYIGMMGALLVQNARGIQFRIGTGFTDEVRRHPPPIGSWVTFSYENVTARGIPRFARYLRMRAH